MAQSPARVSTSPPLGASAAGNAGAPRTAYTVLAAVSVSHLLNDTIQSLLPAIYPILKASFGLSFAQVGLMTLALMLTASVLQPVVGLIGDRRPVPLALAAGMGFTLAGLLLLSVAWTYPLLILAAALVVPLLLLAPIYLLSLLCKVPFDEALLSFLNSPRALIGIACGYLLCAFIVAMTRLNCSPPDTSNR